MHAMQHLSNLAALSVFSSAWVVVRCTEGIKKTSLCPEGTVHREQVVSGEVHYIFAQ